MIVEWEAETQALINAAGLEVRHEDVNTAIRQWLRQILRHRRYLERIKSDPALQKKFKAKREAYKREYDLHGPKRDRKKEPKETGKIFAEDMAERMAKCLKEDRGAEIRDRGRRLERKKGAL